MPSPQSPGNTAGSGSADAQIIQKIQAGDRAAFKKIYIDHVVPLVRYVSGLLQGRDGSEDIVQDVFASIWERRTSWNPQGPIVAYLYKAVRNRTLNVLEHDGIVSRVVDENQYGINSQSGLNNKYAVDASNHIPVIQGGSLIPLPNQSLEQGEMQQYVIAAINTLHERRRVAILLRVVHELEYDEIARAMEVSERAARILVSRAREELRGILGDLLR